MTLEEYFGDWLKVIDVNELNNVMTKLNSLYSKTLVCPTQKDVFKAFNLCNLHDLKVVFIGQDPYPQKDVATGVLFGTNNISTPSLEVIKEAAINYEVPHNTIIFDDTLESWAKQGILMINSALTVEMNKIGSHIMLWRSFICKLLKNISNHDTAILYVLFGKQAQTFKPYINLNHNYLIEINHPSYYARTNTKMPYEVFLEINDLMIKLYGTTIKWYQEY